MSTTILAANSRTSASPRSCRRSAGIRLDWIDYAKGIGIALMVFGHVWRGVHSASLPLPAHLYRFVDSAIYSFHMPLFFFLSGLFAGRQAARGVGRFVSDKLGTIVYPYVVWSVIQGGMNVALSSKTNTPMNPSDLVRDILIAPYAQFWFLYVLMLINLAFLVLYRSGLSATAILGLALAGLGALAVPGFDPPGVLRLTFLYLPYFALGHMFAACTVDRSVALPTQVLAAIAATSALFILAFAAFGRPLGLAATFIVAMAGVAGVVAIATVLDRAQYLSSLRRLGVATMPIYLAHVIGLAGCRIVLMNVLHVRNVPLHLFAGTLAGLGMPLVLWFIVRRARWHYLFTLQRLETPSS